MEALVTGLAPFAAVVASLVGVAVALDQLTQRSRMRRIATWSSELAEAEHNENRLAALNSIRRWAAAWAVATVLVPARYYAEVTVWSMAVPVMLAWRVDSVGIGYLVLIGCGVLWPTLRRGIRVHLERYRVAAEYAAGVPVEPPSLAILYQMEGGTRREFLWAGLLAVGITLGSLSTGQLARDPSNGWWALGVVGGVGLAAIGLSFVRRATPPILGRRASESG